MAEGVSPEVLRRYYDVGWERRWLPRLDHHGVPGDAGYKLRLERTLHLVHPPKTRSFRALDAGCGVGIYAVHLAGRFPGARLVGFDLSPLQVTAATDLAARFEVSDRVEFRTGDLTDPSLKARLGGGWDVILLAEILEHLPEPAPVLSMLRDMAAPGAQLIVSVPQWTPDDHGEPWIYHRVLTGRSNLDNVESRDPAVLPHGEVYTYYHRHYRPEEVRALLVEAGLEVRHHEAVFWQRPARLQGLQWTMLDYLIRRTGWHWVDRALQTMGGTQWAHTLLWDCRVPAGGR
jgi:2-polyprenyl-3-methyl-5-hydroxy-6-metoxy-1,4-benzoquinol methylase